MATNVDTRMEDLERRVRFREATDAVSGMQSNPPAALQPFKPNLQEQAPLTASSSAVSRISAWRVQGGSPRMAILAPTDNGPVRYLRIGDAIDDRLGKVERIYQEGRIWIVKAEHGSVRGGE